MFVCVRWAASEFERDRLDVFPDRARSFAVAAAQVRCCRANVAWHLQCSANQSDANHARQCAEEFVGGELDVGSR
jgi:hypothetical protein